MRNNIALFGEFNELHTMHARHFAGYFKIRDVISRLPIISNII